jgi:DDE superfamily endonuclease
MVHLRHPLLQDVWCTMDGIKLKIQSPPNPIVLNRFYNGWQHDTFVTNIFVFCPDGTIPVCAYNVPGCVHDSAVAEVGGVYSKLQQVYEECGGRVTADSAFAKGKYNWIIKSGQAPTEQNHGVNYDIATLINNQATSMRKSAKWGMRSLQASFPRLKDRIKYEEHGERRIILKC